MRLCAPALRADVAGLLARLEAEGCRAADSALLPGEFLRVPPGARLQALLGRYVTDTAACQVGGAIVKPPLGDAWKCDPQIGWSRTGWTAQTHRRHGLHPSATWNLSRATLH